MKGQWLIYSFKIVVISGRIGTSLYLLPLPITRSQSSVGRSLIFNDNASFILKPAPYISNITALSRKLIQNSLSFFIIDSIASATSLGSIDFGRGLLTRGLLKIEKSTSWTLFSSDRYLKKFLILEIFLAIELLDNFLILSSKRNPLIESFVGLIKSS